MPATVPSAPSAEAPPPACSPEPSAIRGFLLLLPLLLAACSHPWQDYEQSTLVWYSTTDLSAQTEHLELLREIVAVRSLDGVRPPAGVRLALAYHALSLGAPDEARSALEAEARDYPESRGVSEALLSLWQLGPAGQVPR